MIRKKIKVNEPITYFGEGYNIDKPDKNGPIFVKDSDRTGHFWCFGTTRVGKTRLIEIMAEQDIRKGNSVVIIDPKNDSGLLSKVFQITLEENRAEDFFVINTVYPEYSSVVDPLAYYYMPEELVAHIVSGVDANGELFFYSVSYELALIIVQSLISIAEDTGIKPNFNLNDVKCYMSKLKLNGLKEEINLLIKKNADKGIVNPNLIHLKEDLEKILENPDDYYNKITTTLRVALNELTQGNIGRIIGKVNSNKFIKRLEDGKGVIIVLQLGSLMTRNAAFTMGKVFLSMLQSFVGRVFSSDRRLNPPLSIYIDEAQNVMYSGIDDFFAKGGGAGVYLHGFSQSVNQLYAILGQEKSKSILDNTNLKLFMKVPDTETAEYISDHFGEYKKYSPFLSAGRDGSIMLREVDEVYAKPQDIMQLKKREFYLMTYDAIYHGITPDSSKEYIKIVYPEIVT